MKRVQSLEEFESYSSDFDRAVISTPDIATMCSGIHWQVAAHQTLHEEREVIARSDGDNWLVLAYGALNPFLRVFQPLEFSWGFGCPLLGSSFKGRIDLLVNTLEEFRGQWQMMLLTGISTPSLFHTLLLKELSKRYVIEVFAGADSMQTDLSLGAGDFFDRRSPKFRSHLRRSTRLASKESLSFDWYAKESNAEEILKRTLQVECRSWKFKEGKSIFLIKRYKNFYYNIMQRLEKTGDLRALFIQKDGVDIAYIFGGLLDVVYRGFQLGYDDHYSSLSLGHLAQWEMIQRLADEGIKLYDLGMVMDYKKRWSDKILHLINIAIYPRLP